MMNLITEEELQELASTSQLELGFQRASSSRLTSKQDKAVFVDLRTLSLGMWDVTL